MLLLKKHTNLVLVTISITPISLAVTLRLVHQQPRWQWVLCAEGRLWAFPVSLRPTSSTTELKDETPAVC
ncbi:hypothetical protein PF008_g14345 [Phytophthora fragariae]|uniref:Uncharacterized protein n=1 Tax=Phytophthora fragariae TaxID=53985 RepID=A0A6G0RHD9_9STRA|nr:hypothetical protein PF008_g14345 [Phytophthora fragariae]